MIIMKASVPLASVRGICANGLASYLQDGTITLQRYYDNQMTTFKGGGFTVEDTAQILCAKHRFELSKFLKTFGNEWVTSQYSLAVASDSYYGSIGGGIGRGLKKVFAGPVAALFNVKNMAGSHTGFTTAATYRHANTEEGLSDNGYYIMVMPSAWVQGYGYDVVTIMTPNQGLSFKSLAAVAGPSVKGVKDQSGKATPIDWFHVTKRRTERSRQDVEEFNRNQF